MLFEKGKSLKICKLFWTTPLQTHTHSLEPRVCGWGWGGVGAGGAGEGRCLWLIFQKVPFSFRVLHPSGISFLRYRQLRSVRFSMVSMGSERPMNNALLTDSLKFPSITFVSRVCLIDDGLLSSFQ